MKIASINLRDSFSHESRIEPVVRSIDEINPDVAILSEAYEEGKDEHLNEVNQRLIRLGYKVSTTLYDDDDNRLGGDGLMVINRLDNEPAETVLLYGRNALLTYAGGLSILGVHFDDRDEKRRLTQARAAIGPHVIGGDFNAASRVWRLAKYSTILPAHYPTAERPRINKLERISNIIHRTGALAASQVLGALESGGYENTNRRHQATWPSRLPVLDLDKIVAMRGLNWRDFTVHPTVPGLDHRPISVEIEV